MHASAPAPAATPVATAKADAVAQANRIHALFRRNANRFRDVAFAARLADETLDKITPKHPHWSALRAIQIRARDQMRHLSARSIKLARAEIAILAGGCHV